jgi:mono/diheme cytochrome c family protein
LAVFDREAIMKTTLMVSFMGLLILIGVAVASSPDAAADHGKEIYAVQKCALCHSISGIGGKKLALDGVGSRLKPEDIRKWIRTPKEMKANTTMKPYPNLPEKDLGDLTAYLSTLK